MTDEQPKVMETAVDDAMELLKGRQAAFKPKAYVAEEEIEMKHMRGKYAGETMIANRKAGEFDSGDKYHDVTIMVRVSGNGPKVKVSGKGRWVTQKYSLIDKKNKQGEIYKTGAEEVDRLLDDLHTMGMPTTFNDMKELDGILAELNGKKDMNSKWIVSSGHECFMEIKPRYNYISEKKYELKFDKEGFPMQKFIFIPNIAGYVKEGEETTQGGM